MSLLSLSEDRRRAHEADRLGLGRQVTHGFPVSPNPLFTSPAPFTHENRAGLQDQTLSSVASSFVALAKDIPSELLSGTVGTNADPGERDKELEVLVANEGVGKVARWLSDWHLLRFLTDCGMFEEVRRASRSLHYQYRKLTRRRPQNDLRLMCRIATMRPTDRSIASQRDLATALAQLFASPGWQTFMVVAQEQGESRCQSPVLPPVAHDGLAAPAPPPRTYPGGSDASTQPQQPTQTLDGFDIPPDIDMPPETSTSGSGAAVDAVAGAGGGGGGGGAKVCPHCTFENPPDAGADCEVCGLPLLG